MSYLLPENDIDNVWDEMGRTAVGDPYWEPILTRWANRIWKENHLHKLEDRFTDINNEWLLTYDTVQLEYHYLNNEKTPPEHKIPIQSELANQQLLMAMLRAELDGIERRINDATS